MDLKSEPPSSPPDIIIVDEQPSIPTPPPPPPRRVSVVPISRKRPAGQSIEELIEEAIHGKGRDRVRERERREVSADRTLSLPEERMLIVGTDGTMDPFRDEFRRIHGRLSLGPADQYIITREEVHRRINGPEKLNNSTLGVNLRWPKKANGGEELRRKVAAANLQWNHNRQAIKPTRVTALCEAEALHMINELACMTEDYFPTREIAKQIVDDSNSLLTHEEIEKFLEVNTALDSVMHMVLPPITGITPRHSNDVAFNHAIEHFSNVTHGIGIVSQRTWTDQLAKIAIGIHELTTD